MKKTASIILAILLALTMVGCGDDPAPTPAPSQPTGVTIPDIAETDEATAKNVLSSSGFIPTVKYEYNDNVEEGLVIKTEPAIGENVEKNSKVIIYVSKGPSYLQAKDSRIEWYHLDGGTDDWHFYTPYIRNGVLYINCYDVAFGRSVEWRDQYDKGYIIGIASVTDSFDKTIPVQAKYEKKKWKAKESQAFTLEISLADLDISKPTDMYLELFTENRGDVRVNFYMSW